MSRCDKGLSGSATVLGQVKPHRCPMTNHIGKRELSFFKTAFVLAALWNLAGGIIGYFNPGHAFQLLFEHRGLSLMAQGQLAQAVTELRRLTAAEPEVTSHHLRFAEALLALGNVANGRPVARGQVVVVAA